ncbi:hypothetical protein LTR08_009009 [Meristemomyces frigidus]|nr:hypothetical protein LTR08_009009 [Meristemomyces frigidus]
MPFPPITPPLVNSSNPWATTLEDLQALFDCEITGAVTTRTSLLEGFAHNPAVHQHTFFDPHNHEPTSTRDGEVPPEYSGSLNTLGYSPVPLDQYLAMLPQVVEHSPHPDAIRLNKPFIISVTGDAHAVLECHRRIQTAQLTISSPLCMEINLSCPNIPDKPPPAYSGPALTAYLTLLAAEPPPPPPQRRIAIGIKTPPYNYTDQYKTLIAALLASLTPAKISPIDFITATNTLGSSLVLASASGRPALPGAGIGGMAGAPLHPLALGNVRTIHTLLQHAALDGVKLIGVGGVSDRAGFDRMCSVGADVVGVGTALGAGGVGVFERILDEGRGGV